MKLLEREVELWKGLEHQNIVQLYEVITLEGKVYLSMEYAEEGELFRLLEDHPNGLPEKQALRIFVQICSAIKYMHDHNIAHRDIKLENAFLSGGVAKLGDFGFAARALPNQECDEWLGSPEYSAPEILRNEPYHPKRSDSWSLGVVLFSLMTGYLPFSRAEDDSPGSENVEQRVRERVLSGDYSIPEFIPDELRNIIYNLLVQSPNMRWTPARILEDCYLQQYITVDQPKKTKTLGNISVCDLSGVSESMQAKGSKPNAAYALCKIIQKNPHRYEWRAYSSDNSSFSTTNDNDLGDNFVPSERIPGNKSFLDDNSTPELFVYSQVPTRGHSLWQNAFGFLKWKSDSTPYKNVDLGSKSDSTTSL
ncbi:BMA-PAR-1, isoform d [Paramicrosporidium saccamoebae]|uniref:BMA-PAR-1, isoform d n=1 Tax=Paramicrosporidium saccamoebae TaxID=1246581 RepID=A0A2H9TQF7_9FUNG|nr:BMA-PAR-1, isoform d [Paramicrosporidium saccamoebae]